MKDVAYLFGAGASANVLPVIKNFKQAIYSELEQLKKNTSKLIAEFSQIENIPKEAFGIDGPVPTSQVIDSLSRELEWLVEICPKKDSENSVKVQSLDEIANGYWLRTESKNYDRLKIALSCYFGLAEARSEIDVRYLNFIQSILTHNDGVIPSHVHLITWNYDYQIERAIAKVNDDKHLSHVDGRVNRVMPFHVGSSMNLPQFIKMNGTAGVSDRLRVYNMYGKLEETSYFEKVKSILYHFSILKGGSGQLCLHYAWETKNNSEFKKYLSNLARVNTLHIIGYSLPEVNIPFDSLLIRSCSNLERIVIADLHANTVINELKEILSNLDLNYYLQGEPRPMGSKDMRPIEIRIAPNVSDKFIIDRLLRPEL